jgi:hypothetical protein
MSASGAITHERVPRAVSGVGFDPRALVRCFGQPNLSVRASALFNESSERDARLCSSIIARSFPISVG